MDDRMHVTHEERVTIVLEGTQLQLFRHLMRKLYDDSRPHFEDEYFCGEPARVTLAMLNELIEI